MAMMIGIASGMAYIHNAKIIHRDLAARNCLYDRSRTVKISDFGLSRPGTSYKMKTAQKMPIKWMAPESILTFTFTQKTDVYTFGVLIYEIFAAIGPYDDMRNSVVKRMIVEGKVNKFPDSTPDYIVNFVKEKLWCKDPDKRPDFQSILAELEKLASTHSEKVEDQMISQVISEGRTTMTTEVEVACENKAAPQKKEKADVGKSPDKTLAAEAVQSQSSKKKKESAAPSEEPAAKSIVKETPQKSVMEAISPPPEKSVAASASQSQSSKKKDSAAPSEQPAAKGTVKETPQKSVMEIVTPPPEKSVAASASKETVLKFSKETTQVDFDSHRDKDDFKDVEIRTKPVFGRRSRF
ncbi:hypothetical protein GCK32_016237, partial [Trichostrongylus colubriformis]